MRIGGDCCGVWSAEFDIRIEALRLQDILAKLGIEGEGFGGIDGRIRLRGRGTSVDKLVGSADGQAALTVDGGAIDALIIEAIGLDIAESILVLLDSIGQTEEDKTPIRCAIVNLEFEGGVATTRPVLIDTVDSKITIDGQVNLRDETLDIFIESRPKDPSLFSANQPMMLTVRCCRVRQSGARADRERGFGLAAGARRGVAVPRHWRRGGQPLRQPHR